MAKYHVDTYRELARTYYDEKEQDLDFRHIERVLRRIPLLAKGFASPPCPYKLYFLACFHELGPLIAANAPVRQDIRTFLGDLGWSPDEIEDSFLALPALLTDPQSPEEMIVHDANNLDLLGPLGIARAFLSGGTEALTCEETAAIFESQYVDRLTFHTPFGTRLAEEGRLYVKEFLKRLRNEW